MATCSSGDVSGAPMAPCAAKPVCPTADESVTKTRTCSRSAWLHVLCRGEYWRRYWSLRLKSQIPPAVNSSTGSTAASSTPPSQAGSEATPTQRPRFVDWEPVTMAEPTYKCPVNMCREQRSVIEPGPSSPSIGNSSSYSYSSDEESEDPDMPLGS